MHAVLCAYYHTSMPIEALYVTRKCFFDLASALSMFTSVVDVPMLATTIQALASKNSRICILL